MDAIRDKNYKPVALWVDSTDPTKTLPLLINPITGRVLIEISWGWWWNTILNWIEDPTTEWADWDFYINTSNWTIFWPKNTTWGTWTSLIWNGIVSIDLFSGTHAPWTMDTYEITYDNATTDYFEVYNWANWTWSWDMLSDNNLSDLENISTARDNLEVYSTSETDSLLDNLNILLSSWLIKWWILTINWTDPTKVDISAWKWLIIDNYTDPENPVIKVVTWSDMIWVTVNYRTTDDETWFYITRAGAWNWVWTLNQQNTSRYTSDQMRDVIILGWASHPWHWDIESAFAENNFIPDFVVQMREFIETFAWHYNVRWNVYSLLTWWELSRTAWDTFDLWAGQTYKTPNIISTDEENPVVDYYYYYKDSWWVWVNNSTPLTWIDPDNYNSLAWKVAVPTWKFTIQPIYFYALWASSWIWTEIQYWQKYYDTMAEARTDILSMIDVNPWLEYDTLRWWLILQQWISWADYLDTNKALCITATNMSVWSSWWINPISDHDLLNNLDYASSWHTWFQPALWFTPVSKNESIAYSLIFW
jgi:hypothetical protein